MKTDVADAAAPFLERYRGMAKRTEDGEIWVPMRATYTRMKMTGDRDILPTVRLSDGVRGNFEKEVWEGLELAFPRATDGYVTWAEARGRR